MKSGIGQDPTTDSQKHRQLCFVHVICDDFTTVPEQGEPPEQGTSTYRVVGRLMSHDIRTCRVVLQDPFKLTKKLLIDTTFIEPFSSHTGSLFEVLGEVERQEEGTVIKARIVKCVDGMDMDLLRDSLELQRDYFESRMGAS